MPLNPPQQKAVEYSKGPILVLAGAGSGKTRVITARIARLLESGVSPREICAVTFTNKAAREMKERIYSLTKKRLTGMFTGTYHALGLKILKQYPESVGLKPNFSIQGRDDQLAIATELQREFELDPEECPDKTLIWGFSQAKNCGLPLDEIPGWLQSRSVNLPEFEWGKLFSRYNEILRNYNSVDFDDLILLPRDLLKQDGELRKQMQSRYRHFLADEYQDTNPLQFDFLRLFLTEPYQLCAVGDDDQAIYGWRGADIEIILNFKKTYPNAEMIYLEQNYRSSQYILDLANAVISNNTGRHPKKLWSSERNPDKAVIQECADQKEEAEQVALWIKQRSRNTPFSEMAVLLRTNFQSRPFEEEFRRHNIPYRISGGYQFYDRKEIKDIIAYLRFIANQQDEKSLIRILNFPRRGIGDATVHKLKKYSVSSGERLWEIIENIESCPVNLQSSVLSALLEFRELIQNLKDEFHHAKGISEAAYSLVQTLHLEKEFEREGLEENVVAAKLGLVKDLCVAIANFEQGFESEKGKMPTLYDFLQYLTLLTNDTEDDGSKTEKVQIMTFHQAKGLEFHTVFLVGLEEGLLPHTRSMEDDESNSLEEERRLFYVGITRAKRKIFFTYCATRKSVGGEIPKEPSRFLQELPQSKIEWLRMGDQTEIQDESFNEMLSLLDAL